MSKIKLTIGMAIFDEEGLWSTIQALRLYIPPKALAHIELVVVDNNPTSKMGQIAKHFVTNWVASRFGNVQYIAMDNPKGTAPPRNKIFEVATGDYVLVADPHILLDYNHDTKKHAVERLIEFYESNPHTQDLFSGPIWMDTLEAVQTQFNDEFRDGMWGVWSTAWRCKCGVNGVKFSPVQDAVNKRVKYVSLDTGNIPITSCGVCNQPLPDLQFNGSQQALTKLGYYRLGISDDDEQFEIPGNGLGLFTCRRDAWLGFNEHFRQFGGEELYIHTKYKFYGRTTYCLPFLKWVHKFRPTDERPPYPMNTYGRVRNYVLGFQELGLSLDRIYDHFVREKKWLTDNEWNWLLENPIERSTLQIAKPCTVGCPETIKAESVEELYEAIVKLPRDIDTHMPKLKELAAKCAHITEFSPKRESLIALATSANAKIVSYNLEASDTTIASLNKLRENLDLSIKGTDDVAEIEQTDLLFIDSKHTAGKLAEELNKYHEKVNRYIVLHFTQKHQEKGEDGGAGLLTALRVFLRTNPQWSVVYHSELQNGLTVISCYAADKPELPTITTQAVNAWRAAVAFVKTTGAQVEPEEYERRLDICTVCPKRNGDKCSVCGCFLKAKATLQSQDCPIAKWSVPQ